MTPRFPLRPGGSRLPPGFQLTPDGGVLRHLTPTTPLAPVPMIPAFSGRVLYVPEQQAVLPSTPPIPPSVVSGDIITATHENTVTTSLGDLWVNEQWIAAHMLEDPTSTLGDLIVRDAGALNRLSIGAPATVLTVDVNQPLKLKWAPPTGGVTSVFTRTGDVIAKTGDYTVAQVTGAMADPTTSQGDLIARGVSAVGRVPLGSDGAALFADRGQALGVRWGAITPTGIGAAPATTKIIAGAGLGGGGPISSDVTLTANVVAVNGQTGNVVIDAVPSTTQIIAGTGLTGGGKLTADVTINAAVWSVFGRFGNVIAATGDYTVAQVTGAVPDSRRVLGGTGLTGGGDLTVDRTLSVVNDTTNQQVQVALGGALTSTRRQLNFIAGTDQLINVVDDPTNNRVDVTFTVTGGGGVPGPSLYSVDGAVIATRTELNLISGAGINLTGVDNTGANRVDVTISTPAAVFSVFGRSGMVVAKTGDYLVDQVTGAVPTTRVINAGAGLIGGGDLSADRSFTVVGDTTTQRVQVASAGVVMGTRQEINFIQGANATLAVVDNPGGNRVDVTITGNPAGQNQTPWLSDIDAATHDLNNLGYLGIGRAAVSVNPIFISCDGLNNDAIRITNRTTTSTTGIHILGAEGGNGYGFEVYGTTHSFGANYAGHMEITSMNDIFFTPEGGASEVMRITGASQRVGIGTKAPAYKLDVAGDVNVTGVYRVNGVPISSFVSPLTTKGDVMVFDTATTRLAVGATGQVLTADPAQTSGLKWTTPAAGGAAVAGADTQIQYNKAGVLSADGNLSWDYTHSILYVQSATTTAQIDLLGNQNVQMNLQSNGGNSATIWAMVYSGASYNNGLNLYVTAGHGTQSTPAATQSTDYFLNCLFSGYSGSGLVTGAAIFVRPEANWTTSACPTFISFSTSAGTSGYVERVRISSTGNMGIGNTSPQYKLDVTGDVNISGVYRVNGVPITTGGGGFWVAGTGGAIYYNGGSVGIGNASPANILDVGGAVLGTLAGVHLTVSSNTGNNAINVGQSNANRGRMLWIYNATPALAYMTLDVIGGNPLVLQLSGGNVGIGTTGPQAALDVSGCGVFRGINAQTSGQFCRIGYSGSFGDVLSFDQTAGVFLPLSIRGNPAYFPAGNVGVGTTSPAATLDVAGTIRATASPVPTSGAGIELAYSSNNGYVTCYDRTAAAWKPLQINAATLMLNNATAGGVGIGIIPAGAWLQVHEGANQNVVFALNSGITSIQTLNDACNAYAPVQYLASGHYFMQGNVGIGTTSPSQLLTVNGAALFPGGGPIYFMDPNHGIKGISASGVLIFTFLVPNGIFLQQVTGNVGIGTQSPAQLLTVIPAANASTIATANQIAIGEASNNVSYRLNLGYALLGGAWMGVIQATPVGTPLLLNPSGGRVGINTPNGPSQLFHAHLATDSNIVFWNNGSTSIIECNNDAASADVMLTIAANPLKMIGGNVAIGNITPGYLLVLAGDNAFKPNTTTWYLGSDIRTKRNIRPLEGGLDVIRRVPRPIVAEYNGLGQMPDGTRVVSFDLEKMRAILPHAVTSARGKLREDDNEETDLLALNLHEVLMHLILAVQQLAEKN